MELTTVQKILIISVVGLVIRYFVGVIFTYPRDIASWALNIDNYLSNGGIYGLPGHYYTPVWGYILAPIAFIMGKFGIPTSFMNPDYMGGSEIYPWFTVVPSWDFILIIKTLLFVVDLLVAFVLFKIVVEITDDERKATMAFAIWFLCPLTIDISAIRVMFENIEILFALMSILLILKNMHFTAGIFIGLSLMTKPYVIIMGIVAIGWIFARSGSIKSLFSFLIGSCISILAVMLPVILAGEFGDSMLWLTMRASDTTSGYNAVLNILPIVLGISCVLSFLTAWFKWKDPQIFFLISFMLTGAFLASPGNVQYYLLLLPLAILVESKLMWIFYTVLLILSIQAICTFADWSSYYYLATDWIGSGLVQSLAHALTVIQSNALLLLSKILTGIVAVMVSLFVLMKGVFSWIESKSSF